MSTFSGEMSHSTARSKIAVKRDIPNSQPLPILVDQGPDQMTMGLKRQLLNCLPNDPKLFLFTFFIVVYLVIACIYFARTNDIQMFMVMLPYLAGYNGISIVTPHLPWGQKQGGDQDQQG
jgi:hypothetical protein